jgi:hypothetical protein
MDNEEELELIPDGLDVVPQQGVGWYPAIRLWSGFDGMETIEDAYFWDGEKWIDDSNCTMEFWSIRFDTKIDALNWIDSLHEF